jgi:carbon storage regulator
MLVLSRRRDQSIMIGDDVEITVVDICGDKVRLGIKAPAEMSVHRREIYEAIKEELKVQQTLTSKGTLAPGSSITSPPPGSFDMIIEVPIVPKK